MNDQYHGEFSIDLGDVCFYFLKKWKSLLVLAVVCGLLGGALTLLQTKEVLSSEDYAPSAATVEKMDQAAQARDHFETALASGSEDLTALNNGRALVEALEKAFTGEDLQYYQVNYLGIEKPSEEEAASSETVKFAVIGAFLGCVLWGVWHLVAYLCNSTIKTAEELSFNWGIALLGRVRMETDAKGLMKRLEAWQEKGKRPGVTAAYLAAVIEGAKDSGAVVCGDIQDKAVLNLMKELEHASPRIQTGRFISEDEAALKAVKEAGSSILVIRTWHTTRNQVMRELEMCRIQNIKPLGLIVID